MESSADTYPCNPNSESGSNGVSNQKNARSKPQTKQRPRKPNWNPFTLCLHSQKMSQRYHLTHVNLGGSEETDEIHKEAS
jgi:hypothetical protein